MSEELKCPNCGAPYTGHITPISSYVTCKYCGAKIPVKHEIRIEKEIDLYDFANYLKSKGINTEVDRPSRTLISRFGNVTIEEDGTVNGEGRFKKKIEKWLVEYLKR